MIFGIFHTELGSTGRRTDPDPDPRLTTPTPPPPTDAPLPRLGAWISCKFTLTV